MENQETNIYGNTPTIDTKPSQPTIQAPPPQKPLSPFSFIKRVIFTIIGIICLLGVWETFFPTKPPTQNQTNIQTSTVPSHSIIRKIYTNNKFHYSIQYPDTLDISQYSTYSIVFQIKNRQQLVFPSLYI